MNDGTTAGPARHRRWLVATVALSVLLIGAGVAAAQLIRSPAQAAAETAPPEPDVLTAPVEHRVLKDTIVLRGTVRAGQTVEVAPQSAGGDGAGAPVVTRVPVKAGQRVRDGQVVLEVSGRPVFVLPGAIPVYRDLRPGAEGRDVAQLQSALRGLGHDTGGDAKDAFGEGTKAALARHYASIGYDPRQSETDATDRLATARAAVRAAERALQDAEGLAGGGGESGDGGGQLTGGGGQSAGGSGQLASGGSQSANSGGQSAYGGGQLADAGGSSVGGGQSADSDGRLADAGDQSTGAGDRAAAAGDRPTGAADQSTGAEDQPTDAGVARQRAAQDLAAARTELAAAQAESGPMLPMDEVVFVRGFPAFVDSVTATVGARVSGSVLRLSAGEPVVQGYLQEHQRQLVDTGQPVRILAELSGAETGAVVASVADVPESGKTADGADTEGADPPPAGSYRLTVKPDKALGAGTTGQGVRLTIESASTEGRALVVPVTAVSAGADSRTSVTVLEADGGRRRVEVRVDTQGDGQVAVVPVGARAALRPGEQVIVGLRGTGGLR
ncbi:peptidoglycan-binding protein [Streptomyces sp. NPDC050538]|uniref:peptidoglycan-binding protein n=1 Tax=Streptomyces sp. NPDC050538 TaxID=3365627 RepID=UPI00378F5F29